MSHTRSLPPPSPSSTYFLPFLPLPLAHSLSIYFIPSLFLRYASEADVDFVRRAIKTIGHCAIKIEASAERCVNVLLDLIATRVSYVVQEAIVVIKVGFNVQYLGRVQGKRG